MTRARVRETGQSVCPICEEFHRNLTAEPTKPSRAEWTTTRGGPAVEDPNSTALGLFRVVVKERQQAAPYFGSDCPTPGAVADERTNMDKTRETTGRTTTRWFRLPESRLRPRCRPPIYHRVSGAARGRQGSIPLTSVRYQEPPIAPLTPPSNIDIRVNVVQRREITRYVRTVRMLPISMLFRGIVQERRNMAVDDLSIQRRIIPSTFSSGPCVSRTVAPRGEVLGD